MEGVQHNFGLDHLTEEFYDEIGSDLSDLAERHEVARWINSGLRRLDFFRELETELAWVVGDKVVDFPSDYRSKAKLIPAEGTVIPRYRIWNGALRFEDPEGAREDGAATLLYYAKHPKLTGSQTSLLPELGNDALLQFALYRFYNKLAASRTNYRRYSTIVGANAVDVEDLRQKAADHLADFEDARDSLPGPEPVTFYGD